MKQTSGTEIKPIGLVIAEVLIRDMESLFPGGTDEFTGQLRSMLVEAFAPVFQNAPVTAGDIQIRMFHSDAITAEIGPCAMQLSIFTFGHAVLLAFGSSTEEILEDISRRVTELVPGAASLRVGIVPVDSARYVLVTLGHAPQHL